MYARTAHARKFACANENLHMWMKLARVEMFSGGSEITNTISGIRKSMLQEQTRAWR